ncbi:MAG: LLM class flavin-dependent oxidoreductase [Nitrospinota bacterium]
MSRTSIVLWRHDQIKTDELVRFARGAEDAGMDTLWIPETWVRDASVQLAISAYSTERIRIASGIFNIYSRSPGQLAQTASELDVLSGGRFTLGIGVSGRAVIENWHSQSFDRPLVRTREVISVLRQAFEGARVNFAGQMVKMEGFRLRQRPVQKKMPVYLAANGPANTRLAGEVADGWIPFLIPFSRFEEANAILEEGARRGQRPAPEIDTAPFVLYSPNEDTGRARDLLRPIIGFYVGAMGDYYHGQLTRWGYGDEADRIRGAWKDGGREAVARAVPDNLVDDLALCGPVDRCREGLERLRQAGVTHPILRLPDEMDEAEVLQGIATIPALQ